MSTNPTAQSISVDQLAAMPDEQRVALLQAQDTGALTPMVLALVQAKTDTSRIVLLTWSYISGTTCESADSSTRCPYLFWNGMALHGRGIAWAVRR
jgi:hypothetical protein